MLVEKPDLTPSHIIADRLEPKSNLWLSSDLREWVRLESWNQSADADRILLDQIEAAVGRRDRFFVKLETVLDFSGERHSDRNYSGIKLPEANFRNASLRGTLLTEANLRGADFRGADLTRADLEGVDLTGADLRGADLRGALAVEADFTDAKMEGAELMGADLAGAIMTEAQLDSAEIRNTVTPDGGIDGGVE